MTATIKWGLRCRELMQEPEGSLPPRKQDTASEKLPEGTRPISDAELNKYLRSIDGLSGQERVQPPQPPEEPVEEPPEVPPDPRDRQWWWWVLALVVLSTLGTGAMTALQSNRFCASLRFCSVEKVETVTTALAAARRTAQRLEDTSSLKDFEADTADLEGQLQQIERDGVISDAQRDTLNQLRKKADEAGVRLKRELRDQRIIRQVGADLGNRSPTEQERRNWLQQLQPVAATSFSHREAQALRQRLQPPPPPTPLAQPTIPGPSPTGKRFESHEAATQPSYTPLDPPRTPRAIPSPSPESGNGDNAPYRPEPLW